MTITYFIFLNSSAGLKRNRYFYKGIFPVLFMVKLCKRTTLFFYHIIRIKRVVLNFKFLKHHYGCIPITYLQSYRGVYRVEYFFSSNTLFHQGLHDLIIILYGIKKCKTNVQNIVLFGHLEQDIVYFFVFVSVTLCLRLICVHRTQIVTQTCFS